MKKILLFFRVKNRREEYRHDDPAELLRCVQAILTHLSVCLQGKCVYDRIRSTTDTGSIHQSIRTRKDETMKSRLKIPVTIVILLLNIAGMVYEYAKGQRFVLYSYGMYQGALQDGEYVRLIASAFLHFDIYHLASNMFCLVMYGMSLERRIGSAKYGLIYAIGIIGSGLLINFAGGANGLHAGASGAVWALMTATLIYNLRNSINPAYALRGIIVNLLYSFSAGVSWQGHIGGGIAGAIAAAMLCKSNEQKNLYE